MAECSVEVLDIPKDRVKSVTPETFFKGLSIIVI